MKLVFKVSPKGLRTNMTSGARTFKDGKTYDLPDAEARSLLQRFPHNFIESGKAKIEPVSIEDAPDKMVDESKPKTKKKGKSK